MTLTDTKQEGDNADFQLGLTMGRHDRSMKMERPAYFVGADGNLMCDEIWLIRRVVPSEVSCANGYIVGWREKDGLN